MEPRARAARHKSHINFPTHNLEELLYAFGAPAILPPPPSNPKNNSTTTTAPPPTQPTPQYIPDAANPPPQLPETLRVLDEIVTDFLIETCHTAVTIANYSGRTKLKVSDFEWAIRKDSKKVGHMKMLMSRREAQKKTRADVNLGLGSRGGGEGGEGMGMRFAVDELQALGDVVGEEGTGRGKGRGKGKRRKRKRGDDGGGEDGRDGDTSMVIRGQLDGVGEDDEDDEDFGGGGGRRIKREPSDGGGEMLIEDGLEEERMDRNGR